MSGSANLADLQITAFESDYSAIGASNRKVGLEARSYSGVVEMRQQSFVGAQIMAKFFRLLFQIGLIAGLLLMAPRAMAQSQLGDTSWKATDDCFLTRIDFKTDGTVQVSFDNGDLDVGEWDIDAVTVTITLDKYVDYFLGTYKNGSLQLGHIWIDPDDVPHSEVCTFSEV